VEWLLAPLDATRPHDVGFAVAWHARFMVLAWAILAPLAVLIARFYKVLPGQDWPRVLDSRLWWRTHLIGQIAAGVLTIVALVLIWPVRGENVSIHGILGYGVLSGLVAQVLLGIFRGSKGGPTEVAYGRSIHGDHYDMTRHRLMFEWCHKIIGYTTLALAIVAILAGLWHANGPRWMALVLVAWWIFLIGWGIRLQKSGRMVTTYHAIWGNDPAHPGNCIVPRPRRLPRTRKVIKVKEGRDVRRH